MTTAADLNAARKRRQGRTNTGRCPACGRYRVLCRSGCFEPYDETGTVPATVLLRRMAAERVSRG